MMKCPDCNETLLMMERSQIEIDYCPSCRGVWLDKGELDKLLEYAAQNTPVENPGPQQFNNQGGYNQGSHNQGGYNRDGYNQYGKHQHGYNKPYKKKSFLGDLFDFD